MVELLSSGFTGPSRMHLYNFPSYMVKAMRASEHLGALDAAAEIFRETCSPAIRTVRDPNTGEYVVQMKVASQPPGTIGTLLSDFVHNLRMSLDHFAYRLAIEVSGSDPPPNEKTAAFPIHTSNSAFRSSLKAKIGDPEKIPRPIIKRLTKLQPNNSWEGKQLAVLRDLDDRAKHRELPVCIGVIRPAKVDLLGEDVVLKSLSTGPAEVGEAEIARYEATKPQVDMELRGLFKIAIVFAEGSPAEGESILEWARATRDLVVNGVIKRMAPPRAVLIPVH